MCDICIYLFFLTPSTSETNATKTIVVGPSQVRSRDTAAPIGAFMWPLHWSMWVGIFVTLHLTALFLTLYEWNSPFGMTPHGRNRVRVFSYSSALNLCYAILFGRTVATKVTLQSSSP